MVKIHKTYSLNRTVIDEFEREFPDVNKSRLLEALIIDYLMNFSRETIPTEVEDSSNSSKEIT